MSTTIARASFNSDQIAQAIASAQAIIERVPYQGKAARKEQREYTVKAIAHDKKTVIIEHYIAYDEVDAMAQFADDYGIRAVSAYRTRLAK